MEKITQDSEDPYYAELPPSEIQPIHDYDYPDFSKLDTMPKIGLGVSMTPGGRKQKSIPKQHKGFPVKFGSSKKRKQANEQVGAENKTRANIDAGYISMKRVDTPASTSASSPGQSYVKMVKATFDKNSDGNTKTGRTGRATSAMYINKTSTSKTKQNSSLNLRRPRNVDGKNNIRPKPERPPKPNLDYYTLERTTKPKDKSNDKAVESIQKALERAMKPKDQTNLKAVESIQMVSNVAPKFNVVKPFVNVGPCQSDTLLQSSSRARGKVKSRSRHQMRNQ